jgi:ribosomal protein S18 acetylase RimI-like enzyme
VSDSDNIRIRPGTVEDYPQTYEVLAETFTFHQQAVPEHFRETDSPPPTPAVIAELLRGGQGAWLLAEVEGRIVGFVTLKLRPDVHEPYLEPEVRALVESLGVLPAWRHRGIARGLMVAAEKWARQRGAQRLMLNVWEFNVGALSLYADLGYTTFSRNLWKAL